MTTKPSSTSRDRTEVPEHHTWDLRDLYPGPDDWRTEKDAVAAEVPLLGRCRGTLCASAATLADGLELYSRIDKEVVRLSIYASLLSDQDTRVPVPQGMQQAMQQLAAAVATEASFFEPEILKFGAAAVELAIGAEPRLEPFAFYLRDIVRRAPHTLSDPEERILAAAAPLAGSPADVYSIISNADFPYPVITLKDGSQLKLDHAGYSVARTSEIREDRQKGMSAFFQSLAAFSSTFGATFSGNAQKMLFYARARRYGSALEMALDSPNLPVTVYTRLVDGVRRSLPAFHRYLRLRKRMIDVPELHYFDLYAPLVPALEGHYTPEEALGHLRSALAPLGGEYVDVITRALQERWIDMFPNDGKRSGAYSEGAAFDVHPFILMNYQGTFNDMSTLAHELGHTMHSYFSNRTQPYPRAECHTFVAEVASTFNEELLVDYMLRRMTNDDARLSVLGNYVEGIKSTVFRQTQFAEFELRIHECAQRGEPLTGDSLARLYLDITRHYYGHDEGVCQVDDYIAHEWSFIPHFYRDFYVFQYATSFTASTALVAKVTEGDTAAAARFLTFLGSGGSKYPIELLRDAGVDMTTDAPLDLTIRRMEGAMDEMEAILARRSTKVPNA